MKRKETFKVKILEEKPEEFENDLERLRNGQVTVNSLKILRIVYPEYFKNLLKMQKDELQINKLIYYYRKETEEKRQKYKKEYYKRPYVIAKRKIKSQKYYQRPEVKARMRLYGKKYRQKPEVRARIKAYYRKPEVKEKAKVRRKLRLSLAPRVAI